MTNEFSVYWWDPAGNTHAERRFVPLEEAVEFAENFIRRPAATAGFIAKVMITDGDDCCIWEWVKGKGLVWPTPTMIREASNVH